MDADQKLTELKKAYAEVILHTAKEAAARVMVSERRVLRLEIELKQSKENSLQMLMRLKQMMDSKNSEAEMTSRAQQKRIEELEAQLQEAEDIVTVLREELSAGHGEKVRAPQKVSNSVKDASNKGHSCVFPSLKSCIDDKDLPAIIQRGKGRKRNKSGSTQVGEKLPNSPSLMNEEMRRASPNKKTRTSDPLDRVASGSYLTTTESVKPEKPCEEALVSVSDAFSRLREELERPPTPPIREQLERPPTPIRVELVPLGCMPLTSETHIDDLMTGGVVSQLTSCRVIKYTFQRKRKRGSDLSNKLKKNEENANAALETEEVISVEKSTQDKTKKIENPTLEEIEEIEKSTQETERVISTDDGTEEVISIEKSTQETEKVISTEEPTGENVEQLMSLSGQK